MGKQLKSSAAMTDELGHNKGGRGCLCSCGWGCGCHSGDIYRSGLCARPQCPPHPQPGMPPHISTCQSPAAQQGQLPVPLAHPSFCLALRSPPVGLDSEALASVWWSPAQACDLLLGTGMALIDRQVHTDPRLLPTSMGQWVLVSQPCKRPIPSLPSRCRGCCWLLGPGSDPQLLASPSHSDGDPPP